MTSGCCNIVSFRWAFVRESLKIVYKRGCSRMCLVCENKGKAWIEYLVSSLDVCYLKLLVQLQKGRHEWRTLVQYFFFPLYSEAVSVMSITHVSSCIAGERCECVFSFSNVITFGCKIILYFYCGIFAKLYHLHVLTVLKSRSLEPLERSGTDRACNWISLPLLFTVMYRWCPHTRHKAQVRVEVRFHSFLNLPPDGSQ